MAIDVSQDNLLSLSQAARFVKLGGRSFAPSTIWRWYRKGVAGVKLETICIGRTRYTSVEALQRFFAAVTAAKSGEASGQVDTARNNITSRDDSTREKLRLAGLTAD